MPAIFLKRIKTPLVLLFAIFLFVPLFANAEIIPSGCGNLVNGKLDKECGFPELITLVKNVINKIIELSIPIAAIMFAWAGLKYMTSSIADQKSDAKHIMGNVFKGFVFILAAWLIVTSVLNVLLSKTFVSQINKGAMPVEGVTGGE